MNSARSLRRVAHWPGLSGRTYAYSIHPIEATAEPGQAQPGQAQPGHYVFAREVRPGSFVPVAVGSSSELAGPQAFLEALAAARHDGATHLHVRAAADGEEARHAEEADFLGRWGVVLDGLLATAPAA